MIRAVYRSFATLRSTRVNSKGQGSTERVKLVRDRYFASPLVADIQYIEKYAEKHKIMIGTTIHPFLQRAECHSYALENLTPTIRDHELLVGSKTRFVRGAIPYCNYASSYIIREINKKKQDDQDRVSEIGTGGGIEISSKLASSGKYQKFGGKFVIDNDSYGKLKDIATYFEDKCFQGVSDAFWKQYFPERKYIENGWKSVLYTAPHDPAPDGRIILDFETALRKGLRQIINETKERIEKYEVVTCKDIEKVAFWQASIRVLEATIKWANSYSNQAGVLARGEKDPVRKQELLDIAARLKRVPEFAPRNFADAVQSWWMVYLAGHIEGSYLGYSPGRFDRYMNPYYIADKSVKPDDALELLELVRVKMTELEYMASFSWEGLGSGNLFQNMILGGETRDGISAENEVSMMVLQSAINCKTVAPSLSIWHTSQLSQDLLLKAAEVVKTGVGFPAFFNFNVYLQHEMRKNGSRIPLEDIREFAAMGGCTEPTLEGMSHGIVQPGFINHGKILEIAMNGGVDPQTGLQYRKTLVPHTLKEFKDCYLAHLEDAIGNWQRYWNSTMPAHRKVVNCIYASALTKDCLGRGLSLDDGGAINNTTPTTLSTGMVNVVNSLAAIEHLLENNICTMEELRQAMAKNWVGYEKLQKAALAAPKWGNNDDRADKYYIEMVGKYCTLVEKQTNYLGEKYDPSMLAISTHVPFGKATGATPDGRNKGQQLADGVTSPMPQTDKNGVFAVLKSSQKFDHTKIRGGLLNIKFHPVTLKGQSGSEKLLSLVNTYFQKNAFQIQFNVVDSKTLMDAQKHPENYRDLIVRVAGFSAVFVELSEGIQNEIIARTEHFLGGAGDEFEPKEKHSNTDAYVCNIQDFAVQDGPGIRSTIFTQGCPLRCAWCSNPETQSASPVYLVDRKLCDNCKKCSPLGAKFSIGTKSPDLTGPKTTPDQSGEGVCPKGAIKTSATKMSAQELFEKIKKNIEFYQMSKGGVTLSGGEPLTHPAFAHEFMTLCRGHGIKLGVETCGFWKITPTIRDILEGLDFIYFDVKCFSEETHKKYTKTSNDRILSNLKEISKEYKDKIIVSVPVIPDVNTDIAEFNKMMDYVKECGVTKVRLLPFHPMGAPKYAQLGKTYPYSDDTKIDKATLDKMMKCAKERDLQCTVE